jgi:hypothetical protein
LNIWNRVNYQSCERGVNEAGSDEGEVLTEEDLKDKNYRYEIMDNDADFECPDVQREPFKNAIVWDTTDRPEV